MSNARKLTQAQAEAIRTTWRGVEPLTMAELAQHYGVSPSVVSNIIHGLTYRDDTTPPPNKPTTTRPTLRRLSAEDVVMIRGLHANGTATRTLANDYGVAYSVVWKIVNGLTYGDVA